MDNNPKGSQSESLVAIAVVRQILPLYWPTLPIMYWSFGILRAISEEYSYTTPPLDNSLYKIWRKVSNCNKIHQTALSYQGQGTGRSAKSAPKASAEETTKGHKYQDCEGPGGTAPGDK